MSVLTYIAIVAVIVIVTGLYYLTTRGEYFFARRPDESDEDYRARLQNELMNELYW